MLSKFCVFSRVSPEELRNGSDTLAAGTKRPAIDQIYRVCLTSELSDGAASRFRQSAVQWRRGCESCRLSPPGLIGGVLAPLARTDRAVQIGKKPLRHGPGPGIETCCPEFHSLESWTASAVFRIAFPTHQQLRLRVPAHSHFRSRSPIERPSFSGPGSGWNCDGNRRR